MKYSFFDYKYNIPGYSGQHFDGAERYYYMIFCIVVIPLLVFLLRKTDHRRMTRFFRYLSVFMILLEIAKVAWESYWDVKTGRGFNFSGILPLDTCSIFLFALPLVGFGRGKVRECAAAWLATLGLAGGVSNILFIQALKWYPIFTFGATFSMFYHFMMAFVALWIVASGYLEFTAKDIIYAFIPHAIFSLPVIILDYIFGWDYMLYREAGGVPVINGLAAKLADSGMSWVTTVLMLAVYFGLTALLGGTYILLRHIRRHAAHGDRAFRASRA
ncbi:MAG: YwaF family protein [Clostridia bacterium]|nr:YwaF family protein [Clostridia bacterium]